jgi:hypothetical protein
MSIKIYAPLAALLIAACIPDPEISAGTDAAPPYAGVHVPNRPDSVAPDASSGKAFGAFCVNDSDCASNLCYEAACSAACSFDVANDCRERDAFCVPTRRLGKSCAWSASRR